MDEPKPIGKTLVVGGGVAGIQASLDLSYGGFKVYLVESKDAIGGVMAQLDKTFPTNDCSMCILSPKLVEVGSNPNIELLTRTRITKIEGEAPRFRVTVVSEPRFVDPTKCTGCGVCLEACPIRYQVQLPEAQEARAAYAEATEEAAVKEIIHRHRQEPGNLLPILLDINRHFNWLPRPALEHVSFDLSLPLTEILKVATFYNAFSLVPRGKNIISLCMGTGCFVKGSTRILDQLERELGIRHGQTTDDMEFTLEVVRCIGCCALAPVMRIGNDTFGRLTPSAIPRILASHSNARGQADGAQTEEAA